MSLLDRKYLKISYVFHLHNFLQKYLPLFGVSIGVRQDTVGMFFTKIGPKELHQRVLEEVNALALTILIEYLIVACQDFFVIVAHERLGFRDETLLACDTVRAKDH